jgi:hypothetical protein
VIYPGAWGDADGTAKEVIYDQGITGSSLRQSTAGNRATVKTAITPSGHRVLRFDGGDFYSLDHGLRGGGSGGVNLTVYAVYKPANLSNFQTLLAGVTATPAWIVMQTTGKQRFGKTFTSDATVSTTTVSTVAFNNMNVGYEGTTATYRLAGSADGSPAYSATFSDGSGNALWIREIGRMTQGASLYLEGDLAFLAVYREAHSTGTRQSIEAALATLFGL